VRPATIGASASVEVTVTPDRQARLAEGVVHPVYGTAALVRDMEDAGRALLVPLLEDGEEGVGLRITAEHLAPVPLGAAVVLTATVTSCAARRLVTEVIARRDGAVVARGTFEQAVVDLAAWRASLA
jgi:fluoroacetyl-CoA thioesterase